MQFVKSVALAVKEWWELSGKDVTVDILRSLVGNSPFKDLLLETATGQLNIKTTKKIIKNVMAAGRWDKSSKKLLDSYAFAWVRLKANQEPAKLS